MPTKGARTRERIIAEAAPLFNERGFAGAPLSDVLAIVGLEKGGLYRHFPSKDALALAAFDHAAAQVGERVREALDRAGTAVDRLIAFVDAFVDLTVDPPLPGGCPVFGTAIGRDAAPRALTSRARRGLRGLRGRVADVVRAGIVAGEITRTDPEELASFLVGSVEGALMLSHALGDPAHMRGAGRHLASYLRGLAATSAAAHP
jgi:AcrR family transcriptional regulator